MSIINIKISYHNLLITFFFFRTILSLPAKKTQKPDTPSSIKTSEPEIDYFDYQG